MYPYIFLISELKIEERNGRKLQAFSYIKTTLQSLKRRSFSNNNLIASKGHHIQLCRNLMGAFALSINPIESLTGNFNNFAFLQASQHKPIQQQHCLGMDGCVLRGRTPLRGLHNCVHQCCKRHQGLAGYLCTTSEVENLSTE